MPIEPNLFDDERLAKVRAEQEDPIVQYYIVRTDIPMSSGKIGAQIAHGAMMFLMGYQEVTNQWFHFDSSSPKPPHLIRVEEWLKGSFRKVVLGGTKKDFEKIISDLPVFLVRDAGLTEVDPNSETVLVTWPMLKSSQPTFLKRLQVLK
jgi:PTH2 family peptidyl-tRNA hydrolase